MEDKVEVEYREPRLREKNLNVFEDTTSIVSFVKNIKEPNLSDLQVVCAKKSLLKNPKCSSSPVQLPVQPKHLLQVVSCVLSATVLVVNSIG